MATKGPTPVSEPCSALYRNALRFPHEHWAVLCEHSRRLAFAMRPGLGWWIVPADCRRNGRIRAGTDTGRCAACTHPSDSLAACDRRHARDEDAVRRCALRRPHDLTVLPLPRPMFLAPGVRLPSLLHHARARGSPAEILAACAAAAALPCRRQDVRRSKEIYTLEFNCRMGDPETQVRCCVCRSHILRCGCNPGRELSGSDAQRSVRSRGCAARRVHPCAMRGCCGA